MKMKQTRNRRITDDFDKNFEKITCRRSDVNTGRQSHKAERDTQRARSLTEFRCVQCGTIVPTSRECSGVNNRNHCPACLWSKHVDRDKPGDRRSTCRSRMEPIGLTTKHTPKRYADTGQGELMLVHRCTGCGRFSINRVAADDNAAKIYMLFLQTQRMNTKHLSRLQADGITPLQSCDLTTVHTQLFGWQSILEEFQAASSVSITPETSPSLIEQN